MTGPKLHQTRMGQRLFEVEIPRFVKALERIADALEARPKPEPTVSLSVREVLMCWCAIDSHRYWQVADEHYRKNGDVIDPGSDDPEKVKRLDELQNLADKILTTVTKMPGNEGKSIADIFESLGLVDE